MKKFVYEFLPRFFTSVNISKIIVIFSVGFSLRFLIAYFGGVQVFVEYIHPVSIAFYSFMSIFVVFIGDLFSFFNISIIPDFIIQFFSYLQKNNYFIYYPNYINNNIDNNSVQYYDNNNLNDYLIKNNSTYNNKNRFLSQTKASNLLRESVKNSEMFDDNLTIDNVNKKIVKNSTILDRVRRKLT
jgi:hypothetical protein